MYCQNCGRQLSPEMMFCPDCGTAVVDTPPENPAYTDETEFPYSFSFQKTKGFNHLTYKTIETDVLLNDCLVEMTTKTRFLSSRENIEHSTILLEDIASVSEKRTWDFWDLAFAVFIMIGSRMRHWAWLILVLVFVYDAAGHCIEIQLRNGRKQTIPYSLLVPDNDFVSQLQQMGRFGR